MDNGRFMPDDSTQFDICSEFLIYTVIDFHETSSIVMTALNQQV